MKLDKFMVELNRHMGEIDDTLAEQILSSLTKREYQKVSLEDLKNAIEASTDLIEDDDEHSWLRNLKSLEFLFVCWQPYIGCLDMTMKVIYDGNELHLDIEALDKAKKRLEHDFRYVESSMLDEDDITSMFEDDLLAFFALYGIQLPTRVDVDRGNDT